MASEEMKRVVGDLVEASKRYSSRKDAKNFVESELKKLGAKRVDFLTEQILKRGFDISSKKTSKEKEIIEEVGDVRRKETGKNWPVTSELGSMQFEKGMRAVRNIRTGFFTDEEWEKTNLKEKYKFLDHIEEILKNPGKYRDNDDYETIKLALITSPERANEPVDKLEEAALMALGVLKRRRGSEKQIARMGEERRDQRRAARDILAFWPVAEGASSGGDGPGRVGGRRTPYYTPPYYTPPYYTPPYYTPPYYTPPYYTPPYYTPPYYTPPYYTPQYQAPSVKLIVDSSPMREVHVKVELKKDIRKQFPKKEQLVEELGITKGYAQAAEDIAKEFSDRMTKGGGFADRDEAYGFTDDRLNQKGIADRRVRSYLVNLIVEILYDTAREEWHTLDEWRMAVRPVQFALKRPPQYLAIKRQNDEMTRRFQSPAGAPTGLLRGSIDLNEDRLANDVIDRNTYTYFELTIPPGWYRFTAEPTAYIGAHPGDESGGTAGAAFRCWEITTWGGQPDNVFINDIRMTKSRSANDSRYVRSIRKGVVTHWDNTLEIQINQPTKLLAIYHQDGKVGAGEREAAKRAGGINTYQRMGSSAPKTSTTGLLGNTGGFFKRSGIRNRLSRDVDPRKLEKDPFKLAAVNKGKRILNRYAKAEYTREFVPRQRRFRVRAQELRAQGRQALKARGILQGLITANARAAKRLSGVGLLNKSDGDMLNAAEALYSANSGTNAATAAALQQAHDTLQNYLNAKEKFNADFSSEMEAAAAHLKEYLENKSQSVAITIARQYKMPVNSTDEDELKQALNAYAGEIAENFAARGRTMAHAMMRGLGTMSRSLETFGAASNNIAENIFSLVSGPWIITTAIVLIQFLFALTYIGNSASILYLMPIIAGVFTFILNFADSFSPLDWLTHLMSGAMIGYSAALLLVAIGAPKWSFFGGTDTLPFWLVWIALAFIGIFKFYQSGD